MRLPNYVRDNFKRIIYVRSFRARICLLALVVGVLTSALMRHAIMQTYENRAVKQRTETVQNQLLIVAKHLVSNNYFSTYRLQEPSVIASRQGINAELETISNLYEGRIMIIGKNCKVIRDTYGISEGKTIISAEVIKCFHGENTAGYDSENGYIEMTIPIASTGTDGKSSVVGVMLASVSDETIVSMMDQMNRNALMLEILMILGIIVASVVLSGVLTKPFKKVYDEILKVKEGTSERAISVPDYVETVHIVDAFNDLLGRMNALNDSRQEFVANVSHELRTPMASLKVLADSLLTQPDVPAELYREFMTDMVSEIDRENRIITDLLALVKMDKTAQDLNIVALNVNDLAELTLKRLRPIARKKDVEITFESVRPVIAEVDEVKMTLIMTNLVENAIKYNKEHGWVKVVLDADHQYFTLEVSDSGVGIPEKDLPHVYERFYRADKSHSREIGGTGLGLSITKSAVLMHKGSITVTSTVGEGSCFTVKIPLNHVSGRGRAERVKKIESEDLTKSEEA